MNAQSLGLTLSFEPEAGLKPPRGSTGRPSRSSEPRASPEERVVHPNHPREESTFWCICLCPTRSLRSYEATKVIFLKREQEFSRYSLEEEVVTG